MWRVSGKIKDIFSHIKEGIISSARENRIWIASYFLLPSLLLVAQIFLQSTHSTRIRVSAITLFFVSFCCSLWFYTRLSVLSSFILCFILFGQTYLVTWLLPFTFMDILIGPGLTWIVAILLTIGFTGIGRIRSFNQELLPSITIIQRILLNRFAAGILLFTALSLLFFTPEPESFIKAIAANQVTPEHITREQFTKITRVFTDDFPRTTGYWGKIVLPSFSLKNLLSVAYIIVATSLLWGWSLWRIRQRNPGTKVVRTPSRLGRSSPQNQAELEKKLSFLFTFAGISFLFGLNAPLLSVGGWDLVIIFALFLLGGVGTWITSLELSIIKGGWFVSGFLLGTILIYWPTSITGFLLLGTILQNMSPQLIYAFRLALHFSLGTILVFTSYFIADLHGVGDVDILKCTAAIVSGFIFAGFLVISLNDIPQILKEDSLLTFAFLITIIVVLYIPKIGLNRRANTPVLQILAPNNLAVAPLVAGADWSLKAETQAYRDFAISAQSTEEFQVRISMRDSEEEIIYCASLPWYRFFSKRPDFIITDLVSALVILHRTRRTKKTSYHYRISLITGWLPWRTVTHRDAGESSYTLSPGFHAYQPSNIETTYLPHYGSVSPLFPTGFSGVLSYAIQDKSVAASLLPEPHATLVELGRHAMKDISNKVTRIDKAYRYLSPLYNLMPYVILTREHKDQKHTAKENAILHMVCTGINKLRQDIYVMDIAEAKKIADFLNWLPQNTYKFDALEISKALHDAEFKCRMPVVGHDTDFDAGTEEKVIRFMEELKLVPEFCLNSLTDLNNTEKKPSWWRLKTPPDVPVIGTGILKDSPEEAYLTPLLVVWIPNQPGKLKAVLSALSGFDLLFTSTVNVGEYGLIYIFPRICLPSEVSMPLNGHVYEILQTSDLPDGLCLQIQERVHNENCVVRNVQCLLLKIRDDSNGLQAALDSLYGDIKSTNNNRINTEINIEVAHAFPYTTGIGLCVVLMKEQDLCTTIKAFKCSRHIQKV